MTNYSFTKFKSTTDSAQDSQDRISREMHTYLKFGVKYIDDAFIGISKTDLILIGGRSGGGKTELATQIAMTNALAGKRVYFFALEAELHEIADRIKYKVLAQMFFESGNHTAKYIAYDRWKAGLLNHEFSHFEKMANKKLESLSNLHIRYGSENYTIENYESDLQEIKGKADLIIIDHLHYFDVDEAQANAEIKAIMKKIKALALEHETPVILVSHLRKLDKRSHSLVPDQEDFHGSSDVIKIATKAITIASARGKKCYKYDEAGINLQEFSLSEGSSSFIKLVKNRRNGAVSIPVCLITFRHETNTYSEGYVLGEEKTEKYEPIFVATQRDKSFPRWAEGAKND